MRNATGVLMGAYSILAGSHGRGLGRQQDGLNRYAQGRFTSAWSRGGLIVDKVTAIYEDAIGRLVGRHNRRARGISERPVQTYDDPGGVPEGRQFEHSRRPLGYVLVRDRLWARGSTGGRFTRYTTAMGCPTIGSPPCSRIGTTRYG